MISFFKKYWFNFLLVAVLVVIIFYFLPILKKPYLETDIKKIENASRKAVWWTELVAGCFLLIIGLKGIKKISEFVYLVLGIGSFALMFFFLLNPLFASGAFLLNSLSKKDILEKEYYVSSLDNKQNVAILSNTMEKEMIWGEEIENLNLDEKYDLMDTITISFKKGLLGYKMNPTVKPK